MKWIYRSELIKDHAENVKRTLVLRSMCTYTRSKPNELVPKSGQHSILAAAHRHRKSLMC